MSTKFFAIEIPPGVFTTPTKKMRSSNWAEVNMVRWIEGQLTAIGGQAQYNYSFASRCKMIHGWYGLDHVYRIAYLCESNLYIDVGGTLTDITPAGGIAPPTLLTTGGYSEDPYGASTYGTPRTTTTISALDSLPDAFSLSNFGSILYAMTSPDGRLLQWDPNVGGQAIVTPGAPHGRLFVVTQERFVQIFGCTQDGTADGGSFRRFAWCDQENPTSWNFSDITSQAGFLDVEPASPIIAAIATKAGTLFWTGTTCYVSQFIGVPYVYNYIELAKNCTPWSPASRVATTPYTLWFSQQGLFSFDGTSVLPIPCRVRPWIDDDIDLLNVREQACAVHIPNFSEFWWFFPQLGQPYNTRAVIYNYKEGWWSQADMSRSAGVTGAYTVHNIMADGTIAFQHEAGTAYVNAALPFAESFDLNLTSGSQLITIKQMLPDIEGDISNVQYVLYYRNSRSIGVPEQQTQPIRIRPDGYVDFRTTGRDIRLRFQIAAPLVGLLTLGQHLIDGVARGDR